MSFYNMMNGVNRAAFFMLPCLGKHPDEYPRFRDCFLEDGAESMQPTKLKLLLRVGGGNREDYSEEIEALRSDKQYMSDRDGSLSEGVDGTYAWFIMKIPEEFLADIANIMIGNTCEVSEKYRDLMCEVYPKLESRFRTMFLKADELDSGPGVPAEGKAVIEGETGGVAFNIPGEDE